MIVRFRRNGGQWLVLAISTLALSQNLRAEDLPTDPRVQQAKLANGFTWIFRKHDNPPGRVALMLHVQTGSLNESDAQRGLAHFIEHMSFNGSEHFPPGSLIPYFESIGMEFGQHLNAFTSFDQTAYELFLPSADEAGLDKALTVMSDYAFRDAFPPKEIDKERGVVLEELRSGLSAEQRIMDKLYPQLFSGSRFAQRIPIGKAEVIKSADQALFEDYYRARYRPENMTLIVVGDLDREKIAPLVEKWFGDYKPKAPAKPAENAGFKPFTSERAIIVSDPEYANADVEFMNLEPGVPPTTTVELARAELVERIGTWIADRRLRERIKRGEAPFLSANTSIERFFSEALMSDAEASGQPQDWQKMLEELVVEMQRATKFGFTPHELELARADLTASAERAARTESTRDARGLLSEYNRLINDREPIVSAQQDLDLLRRLLPQIELKEVNDIFKRRFDGSSFCYVVTLPDKPEIKQPSSEDVLNVVRAARSRTIEPPKEAEATLDILAQQPTACKILEQSEDKDLGITHAWLENGVRVHHRFMDYKKDTVYVSISFAGGEIEETAANAGISRVAALALQQLATKRLSSNQITDILTGKNIQVVGSPAEDALVLSIAGSPRDLETGMQLAHALLTEPKIEQSAFDNWRKRTLDALAMQQSMPEFKAAEAMLAVVSGDDPRWTLPDKARVERQDLAASQAWLERILKSAPIEVAIVGEVSREDAFALLCKYVGSLPKRERSAPQLDALRTVKRAAGPLERRVKVETQTPKAMVFAGCIGGSPTNVAEWRGAKMASNVLSTRLTKEVREDAGLVYSISAENAENWAYRDADMLLSGAPCDPNKADEVAGAIGRIFGELAEKGPTTEELENARKQILNVLETDEKEPSYWFGILGDLDYHHVNLDEKKRDRAAFEKVTADDVRQAIVKYWTPERIFKAIAVPDGKSSGEKPSPATP